MKTVKRDSAFFVIFLFVFLIALNSCKDESTIPTVHSQQILPKPNYYNDGWNVANLSDVGVNETPLINMLDLLEGNSHRVHSILIVKNGYLVFEKYYSGNQFSGNPGSPNGQFVNYDYDTMHYLASVSKSVTSAIFCIAVDKGFIPNLDEKIVNLMPIYSSILTGTKAEISVKNLLTMQSGLAWDEWTYPYGDPRNDITGLYAASDPIYYVLSRQSTSYPGTTFCYNSGVTNVIGHLVTLKCGMYFINFAEQYLFNALGITKYRCYTIRGNVYLASGGFWLTPRSLAKIGYIYINNGKWNGVNVISENMVNQSLTNHSTPGGLGCPPSTGYGYYWWKNSVNINGQNFDYTFAAGWGEQFTFLIPQKNTVVIINCGYFASPVTVSPFDLLHNYIFESIYYK